MENTGDYIEIITGDEKRIKVPKQISECSTIFKNLLQNYKFDKIERIEKVNSEDLKLLIEFCEEIEYSKIKIEKPFWKYTLRHHLQMLSEKVQNFYNTKLKPNLMAYIKISDYYDVPSLEDLIYLKLYELYGNEKDIKENLQKEIPENALNIDDERKAYLKEKYKYYINKQIEGLSESEINDFCIKYYK